MDLQKLGQRIREKRKEIGIPPATLAKKAGIGRTTLWLLERGENPQTGRPQQPEKKTLERLAHALRLDQAGKEELLNLAGYEPEKQSESELKGKESSQGIFGDGFFFPEGEDMEVALLIEEMRQLLQTPGLDSKQREELIQLIRSFLGWLRFQQQSGRRETKHL